MKIHLTTADVDKAIDYANSRPMLGETQQRRDITNHLNQILELRYGKRWHAFGCVLEAIGVFVCLISIMLVASEPDFLVPGLMATIVAFIVGVIGWRLSDQGGD